MNQWPAKPVGTPTKPCGGTPPRKGSRYGDDFMKPDQGIEGCGHQAEVRLIGADPEPAHGGRPTFARTGALFLCPECDSPMKD